ncbi:hypothetical protein [Nocardia salmonicida]|uniref:hypothetical protein n=1 Tax=Nocardia salmonicida TaxID=53431 RepID=UPI0007A561AF|nr:hypothetical protein [Nocardia salmonicida]
MTEPTSRPRPASPTPRWVKVTGVVIAILVALLVIGLLVGGGEHGPGRHVSSAEVAEYVR